MTDSGVNVYRLKTGKNMGMFSVPACLIEKEGVGLQWANYYPGGKSIWVDENEKLTSETQWFEGEEDGLNPCELQVSKTNKILNEFLQRHPFMNNKFELYSEEIVAERQIAEYNKVDQAFAIIKESDDTKLKAKSLAILGMEAYGWSLAKVKATLTKLAIENPSKIIDKCEESDYKGKYLAAMAIYSNVVKQNDMGSAVVWNSGLEGVILELAKGEQPIEKLGEFLTRTTNESLTVLQTIGEKIDELNARALEVVVPVVAESEKDKEIAKLKEMLAAMQQPETTDYTKFVAGLDLKGTQDEYVKRFNNLPPAQSKNIQWLKNKLKE